MRGVAEKDRIDRIQDIGRMIGERMRIARLLLGHSQTDVASILRCSPQQLSKIEEGKNTVCAADLYALVQALDVPLMFFFGHQWKTMPMTNIQRPKTVYAATQDMRHPKNTDLRDTIIKALQINAAREFA